MNNLSIIIPCYNEAQSLPNLFKICRKACLDKSYVEFIFINNGSTDNSATVFETLSSKTENSYARLVTIPVNKGYGYGILQGLQQANGQVLAWTHADLQTNPADVILAYEKFEEDLKNQKCIVKGKRIGRNWLDALFTSGMSIFASVLLSSHLKDINAQPKIFHRSLLSKLDRAPYDFSLDLYLLYIAKKNGFCIKSYPVFFNKRECGVSKGGGTLKGKFKLSKRTFSYIFELRKSMKRGER